MNSTAHLKAELEEARLAIRARHDAGQGGMETAMELCHAVDTAIEKLFRTEKGEFTGALVALGGYGRGALNPYSDVDLLFLMNEPARAKENHPPQTMLGRLWDLGLKVGHASRTIRDAMEIGKTDNESRTAMMESRRIAGSAELYDQFQKRYRWEIIRRKADAFVASKVEEMNKRRAQYGGVIRLTEPNIKNSPGGLRDLQAAMWMIRARENVETIEDLAALGLIGAEEIAPVNQAYSFLMRLRNALHFLSGSAFDKLAHELAPRIAEAEGIEGSKNVKSAELMRRYYRAAQVIRDFSSELVSLAAGYGGFGKKLLFKIPRADRFGLFSENGKLRAKNFPPQDLSGPPDALLGVCRRLAMEDLTPSKKALGGLELMLEKGPADWFTGPVAGGWLMETLKLERSERALRALLRAGILTRMIPEFSAVEGLSQFDQYHRYSVDEHILQTIKKLESIPEGPQICPELRALYRHSKNLPALKLALLFHDLGKRAEDHHATEDCPFVRPALERLGLGRLADEVYFLVKNHLVMSETAQKLNFQDPETLKRFCSVVGTRENLKNLYLITHADIAGVGPDIWSQWKDRLLLNLYNLAVRYMIEGDGVFLSGPEHVAYLAKKTAELATLPAEETASFLSAAPEKYVHTCSPEAIAEHMALARKTAGGALALSFSANPGDMTGEFTIAFPERMGMLSILSGAFAAKDINIVEMIVHTFSNGVALDTVVARGALAAFSDAQVAANFERELNALMTGEKKVEDMISRRTRYIKPSAPATIIEPRVSILNNLSEINTVIEITAPDRLGLLHSITSAMASMGINIESAKISTEGNTAVNVFYVTQADGGKLAGEEKERAVAAGLLAALA